VNAATVRVLSENGFDVVVPPAQGCCGALHAHAGDEQAAHRLARENVAAFAGLDAVILNSAGCGAALRDVAHWLPGEAEPLAASIRDVSEFLVDVGLRAPRRTLDLRVCYDDPCHLVHGQGVAAAPRELLRTIPGLTLVDHTEASACCGAAGTYNLTQPEMSQAVLALKLDFLAAAAPDVVATGNPGCIMQLRAGARSRGLGWRVEHPISLLAAAYD
jgi:glycolate oxidase iron-sulfur subunit